MDQHRDHVVTRVGPPLFPEPFEIRQALGELLAPLSAGLHHSTGFGQRRDDVGPAGELAPIFQREVEERCQHQRGQLHRHRLDPVERLALGERVKHCSRSFADERLEVPQIARRHHRLHRAALAGVLGRVHGDKRHELYRVGRLSVDRRPDRDAVRGRERLVVALDGADVGPLSHRPVATRGAQLVEVDRIFPAQAREVIVPTVVAKQVGVQRVDVFEGKFGRLRDTAAEDGLFPLGMSTGTGPPRLPLSLSRVCHVGHPQRRIGCDSTANCRPYGDGSRGSPSTRSPMMLRWISLVPPAMRIPGAYRNASVSGESSMASAPRRPAPIETSS